MTLCSILQKETTSEYHQCRHMSSGVPTRKFMRCMLLVSYQIGSKNSHQAKIKPANLPLHQYDAFNFKQQSDLPAEVLQLPNWQQLPSSQQPLGP